jgi:hypothetical protein
MKYSAFAVYVPSCPRATQGGHCVLGPCLADSHVSHHSPVHPIVPFLSISGNQNNISI